MMEKSATNLNESDKNVMININATIQNDNE